VPAARKPASRATSIVAILGADSYRAEVGLREALTAAQLADQPDALQAFRGDETTWTRLVDVVRTGSLFAARRAVIVRGADQLKGEGEEMVGLLADPPEDVVLILVAGKVDKRKTLWKRITEGATVVDAEPLKGRSLQSFVGTEIRRRGLKIDEDGQTELLERVGQDLRRLIGELEKLDAFAGPGGRLSAEDVAKVLGRGIARPLYRLSDAMMERRLSEVLLLVEERLEDGEPAQRILATLHRSVRQTRAARALQAARAPREQLAARLGVPPFKIGEVMDAARRWSEDELRRAVAALSRADRRMKTGSDPRVALVAAVAEACAPAASARPRGAGR
jgi:DNA polymerase-3 subunit delta